MYKLRTIENILDEKLKGNDKNLVDTILSYVLEKCSNCGEKCLINDLQIYDCMEYSCPEKMYVCDDCLSEACCINCGYPIQTCGKCRRGNILNVGEMCGKPLCKNTYSYCEDCMWDTLHKCSECESVYCCSKIYKIHNRFFCVDCINNSLTFTPK